MSRSSLPKYKPAPKPPCLPGASHYWMLETAQTAANDGRVGTSDGICQNCNAKYTFYNSIVDYDNRASQQLFLGQPA